MRDAVWRPASFSSLGAALVLAPLAPAMRDAVRRATTNSPLGAAPQLTLPLAHGTPPGSLHAGAAQTQLRRAITTATHPLSALNDPLVHIKHPTHDGGSARAGQTLGSACRAKMVKSAWGGRTVGCGNAASSLACMAAQSVTVQVGVTAVNGEPSHSPVPSTSPPDAAGGFLSEPHTSGGGRKP
jgi:hypothetical protein